MSTLQIGGAFVLGVVVGIGGFMYYMRYRARKQMQQMQDQLGGMFEGGMDLDGEMDLEGADLDEDALP